MPAVKNAAWVRNPIDAFVLAKLEARDWKPAAPATPRQLMRRAYLDITGLPPTLEEQDAFLKKPNFDRLTADLLARSSYGESGRDIGSTWFVLPRRTAMSAMRQSRPRGVIAIM